MEILDVVREVGDGNTNTDMTGVRRTESCV